MVLFLWKAVWQSLIMGFAFLIPFALCRTADIALGAVLASKLDSLTFDKKKLWRGIKYTLVALFGIACLLAGITMIPPLLEYYKATAVDMTAVKSDLNKIMIASTIALSAVTYGKDAFEKLKLYLQRGAPPDNTAAETTTDK